MSLRRVPAYLWGFLALIAGITLGGTFPDALTSVANATRAFLSLLVRIAPFLIIGALSPAIATLVRRGMAGRLVGAVLAWFVCASVVGSLLGMVTAGLIFRMPFAPGDTPLSGAAGMLTELRTGGKASAAVVALIAALGIGLIGVRVAPLYSLLARIQRGIAKAGEWMGLAVAPLTFALGIMLGVTFGARIGMSHYGLMILYAAGLALVWWLLFWVLVLPTVGRVRDRMRLLKEYYLPTALFAAGTCSSLATIPVNIANARKYGVREEIADFVIPIGAIVHKGASAMQYMAYGPLLAGYVFGLPISWSHLIAVWPFVVIYTMAAPGVPGAMGLGLWTGVLFASLLGLDDPLRATFVGTWVALAGGIPDMFRTSGNATADGFAALIFSNNFEKYFGRTAVPAHTTPLPADPLRHAPVEQAGAVELGS